MPEKQNNDVKTQDSGRISYLKVFLVFGPHVAAIFTIILCIVLFCKVSHAQKAADENAEMIKGVITQQSDLSNDVMELSDKVDELNSRLEAVSSDTEKMEGEVSELKSSSDSEEGNDDWPKVAYLTFDDGPSPNTSEILDILKEYDVKATFFTVGKDKNSESYRELYRRIVDEGHTLGMHSYSHIYKDIYASKESFTEDFLKISSFLEEVTGVKPKFYRFPGGSNNTQIGDRFPDFAEVLKENNVTYCDWNIYTGDATNPPLSAEEIVNNALDGIEKHEEIIILMHDLSNKDTTVEALPEIIRALKDRGVAIKAIDESTNVIQYQ